MAIVRKTLLMLVCVATIAAYDTYGAGKQEANRAADQQDEAQRDLSQSSNNLQETPRKQITIGNEQFLVEIADDEAERRRGLMFRDHLPERHGMLFIFERPQRVAFWMRDTYIPLSIAYIDNERYVVEIHELEPLSETPVPSQSPIRYALEVNSGLFERLGIGVGDRLELR